MVIDVYAGMSPKNVARCHEGLTVLHVQNVAVVLARVWSGCVLDKLLCVWIDVQIVSETSGRISRSGQQGHAKTKWN